MKKLSWVVLSAFILSNVAFAADDSAPAHTNDNSINTAGTSPTTAPSDSTGAGASAEGMSTAAMVTMGVVVVGAAAALSNSSNSTTTHH